mmetsp:Transcript_16976/g.22031  ORF Transcript_16976/g.22031 Transcript_16976/m.22031 type:complete len:240 (+) Transcript_16976:249-968(+)
MKVQTLLDAALEDGELIGDPIPLPGDCWEWVDDWRIMTGYEPNRAVTVTSSSSPNPYTSAVSSSTSSSSTSNSSSSSSTSVWPNVLRMKSSTLWLSSQPPTHCFDLVFFSNSTKLKECTNNPINQKEYSSITLPIPSINQNQHRHLDEESSPSSLTASSSIVKAPTNATEAEMMAINSFRFQNISVLFCPLKETEINKMEENVGEEENEKLKRQIFHEFNSCLLNASSFKSYSSTHKRS